MYVNFGATFVCIFVMSSYVIKCLYVLHVKLTAHVWLLLTYCLAASAILLQSQGLLLGLEGNCLGLEPWCLGLGIGVSYCHNTAIWSTLKCNKTSRWLVHELQNYLQAAAPRTNCRWGSSSSASILVFASYTKVDDKGVCALQNPSV